MEDTKEIFPVGTKFIKQGRKRKDIETVIDILTTTNLRGEVVKVRYVSVHDFLGQALKDHDICWTTIKRGLIV